MSRAFSPRILAAVAFVSVAVLFVALYQPRARPEIARSDAVASSRFIFTRPEGNTGAGEPTPTPEALVGDFTQLSELDVVTADGLFSDDDKGLLAVDLDRALAYVSQRFGSGPKSRFRAYIGIEESCGLHGIAYTAERITQVFTCPDLPRARAVNIMAHEFVHQLAHDRYGDRHLSADMILLEGVATWGAGKYWLGDQQSFADFVRPWISGGSALPLATSYVGRGISDMNTLYYQWASFVEFLIQVYGRDKFDQLYATGSSNPGSADYAGVYGKTLDQLEAEWRDYVLRSA